MPLRAKPRTVTGRSRSAPAAIASIVSASGSIVAGRLIDDHDSRSSDARNSVTPRRAARIPMIQKRIVIFSSSQPASSK